MGDRSHAQPSHPPKELRRYRPGFNWADSIDETPFEVDLNDDTINPGGLCVRDRYGMWHRLEALYGTETAEWWLD